MVFTGKFIYLLTAITLLGGSPLVGCAPSTVKVPTPASVPTAASTVAATVAPTVAPTPASTPTLVPGNKMVSPDYGVQVFLWGNPSTTDRDLKLAREAGFRWVKQMFQWNYIEGREKGSYEWNESDRIVTAAANHGLKLLVRVDFAPLWARGPQADPGVDGPPTNPQEFADFMGLMARRYKGRVGAYQIWNEPNLARDWGGRRPDAAEYVQMLKLAYRAIKAVDPDVIIISAGLSPTTASGDLATPDVEYLEQMYQAGAKDYFDLLGAHAAGYRSPPEMDPAEVAKDPERTNNDPSPVEARRVYAFRHVEDLRAVMVANGDSAKQVAVLEFGWTSDNRPESPYRWHAVSEEEKAKYMANAFAYGRDNWRPWIGLMSAIYIAAPHWTPADEQYYWSITDKDGKVTPAYTAIKNLKK